MAISVFSIKEESELEKLLKQFSNEEDAEAITNIKELVERNKHEFVLKRAGDVTKTAFVVETKEIAVFYYCELSKPIFCWHEKARIRPRHMLVYDEKLRDYSPSPLPPPPLALGTDWKLEKSANEIIVATALYYPVTSDDPGLLATEFNRRFQPGEFFAKRKQQKKTKEEDGSDRSPRLKIDFGPDLVFSKGTRP